MKKYILFLIAAIAALSSCKKSGDGTSNTLLLSEVYYNGFLDNEYIYAADGRMLRFNQYSVVGNQSKLGLYVLNEHDADGLVIKRKIFASDTLNNYYVLSYDNAKRLARMDWYLTANSLLEYRLYEYDQKDRIAKYTIKNGASNANKSYVEFIYDDQSRLDKQTHYTWKTNKWVKSIETDYTSTGKNPYGHWQKYMTYPSDMLVGELQADSRHTQNFDDDGNVTSDYTETATNKKYNGGGYVTSQTLTKTYVKPVSPNVVRNMEYFYTH